MSIFITAYKSRSSQESISIYANETGATLFTLDTGDKVRVKVGRLGETPILDVISGTPLAGGTSVTAENPASLTLDQDDLDDLTPGVYDIEVAVYDNSDGRIKTAEVGIFHLMNMQGGNLGSS
jgi:hypothetical protein